MYCLYLLSLYHNHHHHTRSSSPRSPIPNTRNRFHVRYIGSSLGVAFFFLWQLSSATCFRCGTRLAERYTQLAVCCMTASFIVILPLRSTQRHQRKALAQRRRCRQTAQRSAGHLTTTQTARHSDRPAETVEPHLRHISRRSLWAEGLEAK